jgi:hypothetical protein
VKPPKSDVICAWCSCNMTPNPDLPHGMVSHGICDACMKQLERKSYGTLHIEQTDPLTRESVISPHHDNYD